MLQMDQLTPEQLMSNWARDFIQMNQGKKGYCGVGEFKEYFKRFKKAYNYGGTAEEILERFQQSGFLTYTKQRIVWQLPLQQRYANNQ